MSSEVYLLALCCQCHVRGSQLSFVDILQIYVFYELGKYYQNHKRYVRSRADQQLGGRGTTASSCEPERYVNGSSNSALQDGGQIDPCGLTAWSFFNDSYTLSISGSSLPVDVSISFPDWSPSCQVHSLDKGLSMTDTPCCLRSWQETKGSHNFAPGHDFQMIRPFIANTARETTPSSGLVEDSPTVLRERRQ